MSGSIENSGNPHPPLSNVGSEDGEFLIDAELLADLLRLPASQIPELMRTQEITSVCERGLDEDDGKYRLTFFYRNRRARLNTDGAGRLVRRSVIDFGDRPMPGALRRRHGGR